MAEQTTEFTELDALLRAGILTADEHAQARRKLATRSHHGNGHNGHNGHNGAGSVHVMRANGGVRQPQRSNGSRAAGASTLQHREPGFDAHFARVQAAPARIAQPRQPVRPPRQGVPPNGVAHPNGFAPHPAAPHPTGQQPASQQPIALKSAEASHTSVMTLPTLDPQTAERPRPAGSRGRHAKQSPPQWPWVLIAAFAAVSVVIVGLAITHHRHHPARAASASQAVRQPAANQPAPPNVVEGSKVGVPVSINVNGADATVTVSKLTALPAAANSRTVTYQSTVTALGVYGSFPLDRTNFTAQSQTGSSYHAQAGSTTPLAKSTVTSGLRVAGTVQFTLPRGQTVQTVLFTTSLGEQLGIWTTY